MSVCSYRTLETTNSVCDLAVEYTTFKTLAEAKAALLNVGLNQYAKVSKPKENLCVFFGPFQSVMSEDLRVVLCGGTMSDLLEPTKFFRTVVGNPSPKGYVGNNYAYYLKRLSDMGILGPYVFQKVEDIGEGWAVEVDEFVWSVVPVLGDIGFDTPEEEVALVWGDIGDDEVFSGVEFIEPVEVLVV